MTSHSVLHGQQTVQELCFIMEDEMHDLFVMCWDWNMPSQPSSGLTVLIVNVSCLTSCMRHLRSIVHVLHLPRQLFEFGHGDHRW